MSDHDPIARWRASMALLARITHPLLVTARFHNAQKLHNLRRRPNSELSPEAQAEIEKRIQQLVEKLDVAIASPTTANINVLLNLQEVRARAVTDRATLARIRRGNPRAGDLPPVVERFRMLRIHMLAE